MYVFLYSESTTKKLFWKIKISIGHFEKKVSFTSNKVFILSFWVLLFRAVSLVMLPSLTPVRIACPTSRILFLRPFKTPSPLKTVDTCSFVGPYFHEHHHNCTINFYDIQRESFQLASSLHYKAGTEKNALTLSNLLLRQFVGI